MRQLKIATQITNRDSQAVEKYLQEISKISMINPEEETTLAQRIKMGDQRALDKLVQANLRFVVSVAKQYQHQGLSLSDLINEGNLGLIKAAQRFDETKGFKFISYAVWWIRQSILQALAEQGRLVRLPQNKIGTYNKANKAYMAFEQEHEREPSTEELAGILEMSETEINNIFQSNTRHTSLDAPVHEAEDVAMGDLLEGGSDTDEDVSVIDVHYKDIQVVNWSLIEFIETDLCDDDFLNNFLDFPLFQEALAKEGNLSEGEIYSFVPALALGGAKEIGYVQKVNAKVHLDFLFQL
jgi:RNA polymerase primary sigma factor